MRPLWTRLAPRRFGGPAPEPLALRWARSPAVHDNWGDKLNPVLVGKLAQRPVVHAREAADPGQPIYSVIGSGLGQLGAEKARARTVVWGTGFVHSDAQLAPPLPRICAVRGPLTRSRLLAQGIECPEVYGDPALLYPIFYDPPVETKFDLGIIQHVRERGIEPLPAIPEPLSVRIIDITGGLEEVVDAVKSCRVIASSSLHGIIAAHSYGVPAAWLKFSDRPLGDGFKFRDYFASVGHDTIAPLIVTPDVTGADLVARAVCPLRPVDLSRLIQACPFMNAVRKAEIESRLSVCWGGRRRGGA
ncbi:polysaccharide pyruvyl transferase family protein [Prosthecomicrobium pneumaticum]|uniref:Polysaccharide pyruvyl transferase domain-containing protein n=1 Tax=Prosthecomicrobium pneumaticum TaxID=81895 RepID=A0A7W9FKV1_9HYPH|nr:polysaccharide pyruvyl transferase family protein [Prosthecomicrobium pneumaticum]MBB5751633.1 hypothetical protein [Prosthecomicrobium pneumaticum]